MKYILAQPYAVHELGNRANQEDAIFPALGEATPNDRLFILCDGMGGHEHGEVASNATCDVLMEKLFQTVNSKVLTDDKLKETIEIVVERLNELDVDDDKKMGTTLAMVAFHKGGVTMAHIGDSRIYHIRPSERRIIYKSRDHSLVYDLYLAGEITKEEMSTHPQKNIITRVLMPQPEQPPKLGITHSADILPGDYFFLCSDGILENITDKDLLDLLCANRTDAEKANMLTIATEDNKDNHTAYIIRVENSIGEDEDEGLLNDEAISRSNAIRYEEGDWAPSQEEEKKPSKHYFLYTLLIVALLAFAAVFAYKKSDKVRVYIDTNEYSSVVVKKVKNIIHKDSNK